MLNLNGKFNLDPSVGYADKSISHRALILASAADGESVIRNVSTCADVIATAECLRALGAEITFSGTTAFVKPIRKVNGDVVLDCKNSGTTARLLAGLVAGLGVKAKFVGDESLSARPMDRVLEPLARLGAKFEKSADCMFQSLGGRLCGADIDAEVNSAQVKSAVLIAGLFADGVTVYREKLQTRAHTERMLESMGADVLTYGNCVRVRKSRLKPLNFDVPNDPSSAAYLAAAAILTGRNIVLPNVLADERRTGFFRVIERGGARIKFLNEKTVLNERVCDIAVSKGRLKPLHADAQDVCDGIDEVPLMAVAALTVKGTHRFCNVSELRQKECDRISATVRMAEECRQRAYMLNGDLIIESNGQLPKDPRFESFGDHRMAMCECVLSVCCGGGSVDETPFNVSFPDFLQALGAGNAKFALIGGDVSDSLSPVLMEHLAKNAGVCCSYEKISLGDNCNYEKLSATLNGYDGVNVTMPYKNKVASLLCASCPSVNTVGKNLAPQSTDGYGLICALKENGVRFENKRVFVVGAGGAAEECVRALLQYGCRIRILNRTAERAEALSKKYSLNEIFEDPAGVLSFVPECDFEKSLVLPKSAEFLFVAAYNGYSGLREQAKARNITYVDGLEMLYHQGAKSFSLWTATEVQKDYDSFLKFYGERGKTK